MPQPESQVGRFGGGGVRSAPLDDDGMALEHCRVWLKWAAAQVEESLRQDSLACGDLLRSLAEVLGPGQPKAAAATAGGEMSGVVIAVQSHDRVMQGLAHVAESLHALHALLGDGRRANTEAWRTLRETQFRAFSMAQERALFSRMLVHQDEVKHEAELSPEDTVELFTGDHGLLEP
jgi:hypothetical protein